MNCATFHLHHDEIEKLAYQFWEKRGRPDGSPWFDWLQAEQQLLHERYLSMRLPFSSILMGPVEY
jgi:hypothetical protein